MTFLFAIIWIGLAFYVGSLGRDKSIGYGGALLISLLLSPVIGLLVVLASGAARKKCKYCGFEDKSGAQFCPGCGKNASGHTQEHYKSIAQNPEALAEMERKKSEERTKKVKEYNKRQNRIIWILLVVLILIVAITIIMKKMDA